MSGDRFGMFYPGAVDILGAELGLSWNGRSFLRWLLFDAPGMDRDTGRLDGITRGFITEASALSPKAVVNVLKALKRARLLDYELVSGHDTGWVHVKLEVVDAVLRRAGGPDDESDRSRRSSARSRRSSARSRRSSARSRRSSAGSRRSTRANSGDAHRERDRVSTGRGGEPPSPLDELDELARQAEAVGADRVVKYVAQHRAWFEADHIDDELVGEAITAARHELDRLAA